MADAASVTQGGEAPASGADTRGTENHDPNPSAMLRHVPGKQLPQRQCPECHEWIASNGLARHLAFVHHKGKG